MEIFEILDTTDQQSELKAKIDKFLNQKRVHDEDKAVLIEWGFRLVNYQKAGGPGDDARVAEVG
jgi:hypothetical protein